MNSGDIKQRQIVLFDGICNLCNGSVMFILQREKNPAFSFASIRSETGKNLLQWCGLPPDYNQALVYIENGEVYLASTAALKIGQKLSFPWPLIASAGFIVPRIIREWVYNRIAQHRYQWFGRRDVCMVPTQSLRARFL